MAKSEEYVKDYIETRLSEGKSVYTLKMERSALSMIYGHSIDITLPVRHGSDVKRSREDTANDKHISRCGKYADVFTVACSSGCRRCDMYSLTVNSLVERDGHYFLDIQKSKGRRDRLAPILPQKAEQVKAIFEKAKETGRQHI